MGKVSTQVGLKFLLEHNHFLVVVMPEEQAHDIIRKWITGQLSTFVGNPNPGEQGGGWALRVDSIRGIHVMDIQQMQQQMMPQTQPARNWPAGTSGLN